MGQLACFVLDLEQHGARRNLAAGVWRAAQHSHATFVGDGREGEDHAIHVDGLLPQCGLIPAEFVEQLRQLELAQQLLKTCCVNIHIKLAYSAELISASSYKKVIFCRALAIQAKPSEQMSRGSRCWSCSSTKHRRPSSRRLKTRSIRSASLMPALSWRLSVSVALW